MSELEIKKRQEYKRNRKKWMIIQIVAIALVAVIGLGCFFVYNRMSRTYYIEYSENSNIDYRVQYKENDFFEEEWVGKDQEYISSLINTVVSDFHYYLSMTEASANFDYQYKIDATLLIADKDSGKPYRTITENLLPLISASAPSANGVEIYESVVIDYNKFNTIATEFIDTYALKNASCTLLITLDVEVLCSSEQFHENNENKYSTALKVPLTKETFSMETTTSVPNAENKVFAYSGAENQDCFFIISVVSGILDFLLILGLVVFLQLTKNEDVTYAARVRKIIKAYRSYIQRIEGEFDEEGYQVIAIKTFTELLGIRDTIQSPILVSENRDETMTQFLIPTNTKILYTYVIKVDNYDSIYNAIREEMVILDNTASEEDLAEALAQPDVILSEIEFVADDDAEFEAAPEEPGVEVVGVVWPEKKTRNKVYRYDPNGETLHEGDMVLVPTRDNARGKDIVRKAAVAHANHRVEIEHIKHPLKKIIGIIKRKAEEALTANVDQSNNDSQK